MLSIYSPDNWVDISKIKINVNKPTDIYFDFLYNKFEGKKDIIFVQVEPNIIYEKFNKEHTLSIIKKIAPIFKYIISYNEDFAHLPNFIKYAYGTTWITPEEESKIDIKKKQFIISNVTNSKRFTNAHVFRQNIYENQLKITNPICFFIGNNTNDIIKKINNNTILGKSKFPLFEKFQFSIAIENSIQKNYFTEKLCDCLVTKTIPIYFGCPNIHDYFDTTGWIILDSENVDDAIKKINAIDESHYIKHIETVEKNYMAVQQYKDFYKTINNALK